MLYIYLLSMNAHPIHILLAFLQAQNSLRKPCQTGKRTIWQDIGDKKADGHAAYPSIHTAKLCLCLRKTLSFPKRDFARLKRVFRELKRGFGAPTLIGKGGREAAFRDYHKAALILSFICFTKAFVSSIKSLISSSDSGT